MAIYKNNQEVKDIYMVGHGLPANAVGLQEDVDYVRYEWLKTNDGAWIDTLINDFTGVNDLTFHVKKLIDSTGSVMGCEGVQNTNRFIFDMAYTQNLQNRLVWYVSTVRNLCEGKDFVVNVNFTDNKVQVNEYTATYTTVAIPKTLRNTCPLFCKKNLNGSPTGRNSIIYMGYFKIDDSMHLVPCRLLHSIPASLDANNKARQEGEYGMIDLVSKKFYGNVNNSGSFTGEGLIQKKVTFAFFGGKHVYGEMQEGVHLRRYGWLKGSTVGSTAPYNTANFSQPTDNLKGHIVEVQMGNPCRNLFFSCTSGEIAYWRNGNDITVKVSDTYTSDKTDRVIFDFINNVIYIGTKSVFITESEMYRFANTARSWGTTRVFGKITCAGIIDYTPCKLLKPIPPELDANGIARAAGECGMYDEVNHKFYGNIASSGTFTVEGMAEGYDYEVYNYLKGTGGCYIDTLINPAWNDQLSATTEVSGQPTVQLENIAIINAFLGESRIGLCVDGSWSSSNPQIVAVHKPEGQIGSIKYYGFSATAEIYISLKVTNNAAPTTSCKINGATWTTGSTSGSNIITALPDTTYKIGRREQNGLDVLKLKNVKINSRNFMPCKLKRAIPAELDANGIARDADECGMVDTYSGLFYGNVNSGGSFSVSDD